MVSRGRGRGRGQASRGRGQGRGRGTPFDASRARLDYGRLEDVIIDPLAAAKAPLPPRTVNRGRGGTRLGTDSPGHVHHGGLGFAALRDISNVQHLSGRALLQPVSFVRGQDQPLLKDPDATLMQPGVHDEHRRHDSQASNPASPSRQLAVVTGPTDGVQEEAPDRANRSHTVPSTTTALLEVEPAVTLESDDDDEDIVYVPPPAGPSDTVAPRPESEATSSLREQTSTGLDAPSAWTTQPPSGEPSRPPSPLRREAVPNSWPSLDTTGPESAGRSETANRKAARRAAKRAARRVRKAQETAVPRTGDSDLERGEGGPPKPVEAHEAIKELSLQERVIKDEAEDEGGMDVDSDLDESNFAARFIKSMAANVHVTTDDISIEQALLELQEMDRRPGAPWTTDSDATSASEAESIIQRVEDARHNGHRSTSPRDRGGAEAETSDDGSVDSDEIPDAYHANEDSDSSDDYDYDDEPLAAGWGEVDANMLQHISRKERKKLFSAIHQADFSAMADDFSSQPVQKRGKGKPKYTLPGVDSDDELLLSLQAQWQADRRSKAARKQARAAARAEAGPTKAQRKKAKRRTGDEADALAEHNLDFIHMRIRTFALDVSAGPALGLPPSNKRQRVAVHLLAEAYGLTSKSVGKGVNRAPVLHRTVRTAVAGVDQRKIQSIINAAEGKAGQKSAAKGRMAALWRVLDGTEDKFRASPIAKNREGAIVGHGAEALDEGNAGFRLLSRMGWSIGERIGMSGGIDAPIAATIKTSRAGLGH